MQQIWQEGFWQDNFWQDGYWPEAEETERPANIVCIDIISETSLLAITAITADRELSVVKRQRRITTQTPTREIGTCPR